MFLKANCMARGLNLHTCGLPHETLMHNREKLKYLQACNNSYKLPSGIAVKEKKKTQHFLIVPLISTKWYTCYLMYFPARCEGSNFNFYRSSKKKKKKDIKLLYVNPKLNFKTEANNSSNNTNYPYLDHSHLNIPHSQKSFFPPSRDLNML